MWPSEVVLSVSPAPCRHPVSPDLARQPSLLVGDRTRLSSPATRRTSVSPRRPTGRRKGGRGQVRSVGRQVGGPGRGRGEEVLVAEVSSVRGEPRDSSVTDC